MANDDIIVNIPRMKIDEKITKIKKLVDDLIKDFNTDNIDDERPINKRLEEYLESENLKFIQSKDNELLKNLIEDDKHLLETGHSQLDNDKIIQEFFNYCVVKCIKEEKLEFMIVVAVLLPDLIKKSCKSIVSNLMMQLSYVKIPSKWCKGKEHEHFIQFHSICENLWGYKFPDYESPLSKFDKLEMIHPHFATLCYAPLPGLCTYPKCSGVLNTLLPHLSPFAKIIISHSSDVLDTSRVSSVMYESVSIQAIIKFKWHAFARWRFFAYCFICISHFILYIVAISKTNKTTEGRWLMIASVILGATLIFNWIRYNIICVLNGVGIINITCIIPLLSLVFPTITGFVFLHNDTSGAFSILQFLQPIAVFLLWCGFIGSLSVFKNVGIFVIVILHIFRKILWPLSLLVMVLFSIAHSLVIYLGPLKDTGVDEASSNNAREAFSTFYKSLTNAWDFILSNYSSLDLWRDDYLVNIFKIFFSLFTSIIVLNLLIALVNNVYEEVLQRAYAEWTMIRARFIVYIELLYMMPSERQNSDYFPLTITYEAFTKDVDEWPKKLEKADIPIPWEDDCTDKIKDVERVIKKMTDELEKLRQKLVEGNLLN